MQRKLKAACAVLLAAVLIASCFAGCSSGSGGRKQSGSNSRCVCDMCEIDDTIYYAPGWSLYAVPADSYDSKMLAHDMGCRALTEYKGRLYFIAQRLTGDTGALSTALEVYDPKTGAFGRLYEHTLNEGLGDSLTFFEVQSFCISGEYIYYIMQTSSVQTVSSSLYRIPIGGGEEEHISDLPANFWPLPYGSMFMFDGKVCLGIFFRDKSADNRLLKIDPSTGEITDGFSWPGSSDDKIFLSGGKITVCSSKVGVASYDTPDTQIGTLVIEDDSIRCCFINGKYAVYSRDEVFLKAENAEYTTFEGVYVYDLESGQETKIRDGYGNVAGICGDWIFYYDESGIASCTDLEQVSGYKFKSKLCRIRADGADNMLM